MHTKTAETGMRAFSSVRFSSAALGFLAPVSLSVLFASDDSVASLAIAAGSRLATSCMSVISVIIAEATARMAKDAGRFFQQSVPCKFTTCIKSRYEKLLRMCACHKRDGRACEEVHLGDSDDRARDNHGDLDEGEHKHGANAGPYGNVLRVRGTDYLALCLLGLRRTVLGGRAGERARERGGEQGGGRQAEREHEWSDLLDVFQFLALLGLCIFVLCLFLLRARRHSNEFLRRAAFRLPPLAGPAFIVCSHGRLLRRLDWQTFPFLFTILFKFP